MLAKVLIGLIIYILLVLFTGRVCAMNDSQGRTK